MDLHRLAEQRSRAYHEAVAERLRREPALIEQARGQLARQLERTDIDSTYARAWQALLKGPRDELLAMLASDSEWARALRQSTPFAGFLPPRERWRLWEETKRRNP